jgi:CDP-6-deoxy-D-xylo-4-hexulose-3-dehydrase
MKHIGGIKMRVGVGDFKLTEKEKAAVLSVLESNRITEGPKTARFEANFSRFIGVKDTVLVNSGTSALITGLQALKQTRAIKNNSKVITTPLTYVATTNAIIHSNLNPCFVDIDLTTFNITPKSISQHLEEATDPSQYSIILPVHLMGYPAKMDQINKIAEKYGTEVFEDSSQAHGTRYKGKICGSMSAASSFSFYVAHNIQVGEMGALSTNDPEIASFARSYKANGRMCDCKICTRSQGTCPKLKNNKSIDPRFTHTEIGYNFKTSDIMAAIGIEQLKKAEDIMKKRYQNVSYLNDMLNFISDKIKLPLLSENVSYLAYPLVIKDPSISREKITRSLENNGIETRPLFNCIPLHQPAYSYLKQKYENKLPNAKYIGENGFYIGCHQYLSQEDLDYVATAFKKII